MLDPMQRPFPSAEFHDVLRDRRERVPAQVQNAQMLQIEHAARELRQTSGGGASGGGGWGRFA